MESVRWERVGSGLRVLKADGYGFELAIVGHAAGWTVHFEGWHEDFDDVEEAIECFAFGLTDACRIARWSRGDRILRWTLEARTDRGWIRGRTSGLLLSPLVEAADVRYFGNAFVRMHPPGGGGAGRGAPSAQRGSFGPGSG